MATNVIKSELIDHLRATGATGSVSTTSTTITGNLDTHQLIDLVRKCEVAKCELKLVAGVLTVVPSLIQ